MKICPKCSKVYSDSEEFNYCHRDGSSLVHLEGENLAYLLEPRSRKADGIWHVFTAHENGVGEKDLGYFDGDILDIAYLLKKEDIDTCLYFKPISVRCVDGCSKIGRVDIQIDLGYKQKVELTDEQKCDLLRTIFDENAFTVTVEDDVISVIM